jgi:hypothetical protein
MSTEDEKLLKEAKKLPWDERLLHKNWKVRNDANIDLASVCDSIMDPKDSRLKEFGETYNPLSAILMNLQSVCSLIPFRSDICCLPFSAFV